MVTRHIYAYHMLRDSSLDQTQRHYLTKRSDGAWQWTRQFPTEALARIHMDHWNNNNTDVTGRAADALNELKDIYTTGQVAKLCKVAPRTVSKWFDSGRLRGYRIPGSQDRRIPRAQLMTFLKEHGFIIPAELLGAE